MNNGAIIGLEIAQICLFIIAFLLIWVEWQKYKRWHL